MRTKINTYITLAIVALFTLTACNSDDNNPVVDPETKGDLILKFQNGFDKVGDIYLNETTATSSSGQKHQFTTLKYIVSNIQLTTDKGEIVDYHLNDPDEGAFIVNQENVEKDGVVYIRLKDVPSGNYKAIQFGIGVPQKAYLLGENGQSKFWAEAKKNGMTWNWAAGYIFLKLEGNYGDQLQYFFQTHGGNRGNIALNNVPDLYREVHLNLPTTARVNPNGKPAIHFVTDFDQYLSGKTPLVLNQTTDNTMSTTPFMLAVMDNLAAAFRVDHVHNN